jgi:hypothetical protein
MQYIVSRNQLPESRAEMNGSAFFVLWQRKREPIGAMAPGDRLFWYNTTQKRIVWETTVTVSDSFEYASKRQAAAAIRRVVGDFDQRQPYFADKAEGGGFGVAWKVKVTRSLALPLPPGLARFPQHGWLRADAGPAAAWVAATAPDVRGTRKQASRGVPSPPTLTAAAQSGAERHRAAASMDSARVESSYALGPAERTLVPRHQHYQVRLRKYLEAKGIVASWEEDFVDVRFGHAGKTYIGEIKVTGMQLSVEEAFRSALGQLLDYADSPTFRSRPAMLMFLDRPLDPRRVDLAASLGVLVVVEHGDTFRLQQPRLAGGPPPPAPLFG